ncbi:MAG: glycosyltransferase family 2 protein [Alistipes sp.]|nr:glycosyltransferase family 2 protein [Alistipes sp.]
MISIIIPSYKPQDYIWECLNSIRNQTFPKENFELILVLNGCKEPYYTKIQEYISNNFVGYNVNFIYTDVGGVSNARNIALDAANGEYITFIDDDDYISPKYLEELYYVASPNTVSMCYPYAFNDGEPNVQLLYSLTTVYEEYHTKLKCKLSSKVRKYFSGPCMKLIHRSIIANMRFERFLSVGEDTLFMFMISKNIEMVSFARPEAIYYRRNRRASAINKKRSKLFYVKTNAFQIGQYVKAFISAPFSYNFIFFISRIVAAIKSMILKIF